MARKQRCLDQLKEENKTDGENEGNDRNIRSGEVPAHQRTNQTTVRRGGAFRVERFVQVMTGGEGRGGEDEKGKQTSDSRLCHRTEAKQLKKPLHLLSRTEPQGQTPRKQNIAS
jgi:hypothetical protein